MLKNTITVLLLLTVVAASGCAQKKQYHQSSLPEPKSFNAHFGDLDTNGDDWVSWGEFKNHFTQATPEVFEALDLNQDKHVDHDEWHAFKEAHGMRHHD
jgi:hypothetical protein